jgi:hypothetical protein
MELCPSWGAIYYRDTEILSFYGTRIYMTVGTRTCHWALFWSRPLITSCVFEIQFNIIAMLYFSVLLHWFVRFHTFARLYYSCIHTQFNYWKFYVMLHVSPHLAIIRKPFFSQNCHAVYLELKYVSVQPITSFTLQLRLFEAYSLFLFGVLVMWFYVWLYVCLCDAFISTVPLMYTAVMVEWMSCYSQLILSCRLRRSLKERDH